MPSVPERAEGRHEHYWPAVPIWILKWPWYQGDEGRKLEVTPGITGYAQAYGRNSLPWHDRLALDVYYVDHLSFLLDVKIFFKTFATVFKREGIYVEQED